MADETKDQRIITLMTNSEVKAIDDWMFANRIKSRGEAMRRLIQIAMELEHPVSFNAALAVAFSQGTDEAFQKLDVALSNPKASLEDKKASLAKTRGWFRRSADHLLQYSGVLLAIMQAYRLPGDPAEVFRMAKQKADTLKSLNNPKDKTFDEILRSVFPELNRELDLKRD